MRSLPIILGTVGLALGVTGAPAAQAGPLCGTPLASSDSAYWEADGNAGDSRGCHDGVTVGNVRYSSPGCPPSGLPVTPPNDQAFDLDGTSAYVRVPDSPLWAFGLTDFRISLCAKFRSYFDSAVTGPCCILVGSDEGPGEVNKWSFAAGARRLIFHTNGPSSARVFFTSDELFEPVLNQWYRLEVRRTTGVTVLIANNVILGTTTTLPSVPNAAAPLTIGQAEGLGFFNGQLDDISICVGPDCAR